MNYDWLQGEKDTLIYIGDTMCSWCYGMAPELSRLKNNHPEFDFRVVNGGLRPFNTEKAADMADFLKSHWVEIEERTGQPFAFEILADPDFVYDTEPASRAVVVARMMKPEIELDFFAAVQTAFYRDNRDTSKLETYLTLTDQFELNRDTFQTLFTDEKTKQYTKSDFQLSQELGIRGFPSLVLKLNNSFTLIANGYQTAENIEKTITNLKSN